MKDAPRIELDPNGWIEVPYKSIFGPDSRREYPGLIRLGWGPSGEGWLKSIERGMPKPEQVVHFRLKSWWAFNQNERIGDPFSRDIVYFTNLNALLDLVDDDEWLLAAEIMRTLGRFDDCLKILGQGGEDSTLSSLIVSDAPLIEERTINQDRTLFQLEDHGYMR